MKQSQQLPRLLAAAFVSLLSGFAIVRAEPKPSFEYLDFPIDVRPAEERIKELTPENLQALASPTGHDELIFSIAAIPPDIVKHKLPGAADPWLYVYGDGHIQCRSIVSGKSDLCEDTLSKAELTWLLHLAVNKAEILSRSSKAIEEAYQSKRNAARSVSYSRCFRYHLVVSAGKNDLDVPEMAIIPYKSRRELGLQGVADLNKYATFLNSRAVLGAPKERESLLADLNKKLKADFPKVSEFKMDDLTSAQRIATGLLMARFETVVELEPNKFQRTDGHISQTTKSDSPVFTIHSGPYRPASIRVRQPAAEESPAPAQNETDSRPVQERGSSLAMLSARLINNKEVQDALKLTDEQKRKAQQISEDLNERIRTSTHPPDDREKSQLMLETLSKIKDMLDDSQQKRLHGINLQYAGPPALSDPATAGELKLTEDQKNSLVEIDKQNRRRRIELIRTEHAKGNSLGDIRDLRDKLREELLKESLAVLTSDQQAQFEKMKGEKVNLDSSLRRVAPSPSAIRATNRCAR